MDDVDALISLIKSNRKRSIVLHPNADADACCSAVMILKTFGNFEIVAPGGVSRSGEKIFGKYNVNWSEGYTECDLIIIVDTSMSNVYCESKSYADKVVVIDHHERNNNISPDIYISRPEYSSCVEVVEDILSRAGITMSHECAECMVMGIISDTGHLKYANSRTIIILGEILKKYGIDIEEISENTRYEMDFSEKMAILKACQRMIIERVNDFIIVSSVIGAFEGNVAKHLVNMGADVAFVGTEGKKGYRISARASLHAVKSGINLGNIMNDVGKDVGGSGGGHAAAAGMSGDGAVDAALHICVMKSVEILRKS